MCKENRVKFFYFLVHLIGPGLSNALTGCHWLNKSLTYIKNKQTNKESITRKPLNNFLFWRFSSGREVNFHITSVSLFAFGCGLIRFDGSYIKVKNGLLYNTLISRKTSERLGDCHLKTDRKKIKRTMNPNTILLEK